MEYLKQIQGEKEKDDYRFAMLAAEIRRGNAKNPTAVRMKDFILNFGKVNKKSKKQKVRDSKSFWGALVSTKVKD